MPKYYEFKVCGYYLYYTAHCIIVLLRLCMSMQVIRNLLNLVQLSFLLKVTVTQLLKDRESSLKEK